MDEKTKIEVMVSTVLLPISGITVGGDYETCIFYPNTSEVVERYTDRQSAERGHARWVGKINNGFEQEGC